VSPKNRNRAVIDARKKWNEKLKCKITGCTSRHAGFNGVCSKHLTTKQTMGDRRSAGRASTSRSSARSL
jgi:hypothetical protein